MKASFCLAFSDTTPAGEGRTASLLPGEGKSLGLHSASSDVQAGMLITAGWGWGSQQPSGPPLIPFCLGGAGVLETHSSSTLIRTALIQNVVISCMVWDS